MGGPAKWMAAALLAGLAGCDTYTLFTGNEIPESAEVGATPYPRLVSVPEAPPPGEFDQNVPDPAQGTAILVDLSATANAAARRAEILNDPVLTDAERLALLRAASRR